MNAILWNEVIFFSLIIYHMKKESYSNKIAES